MLPPGVNAEDFRSVLKEFERVVGKEWVFSSPEDVELYRDSYSIYWGEKDERVASAAVSPSKVEDVQAIVRIANRYKIPLYAISTGKNLAYGGAAPNYSGSVVVDLKRMNKIIEVNDKRNFAIVEPGVSYFDLYRYIEEHGLKLWMDAPDPGWGSPIGNALDRGVGYTYGQYRDHFNAHCGIEVVLANGEIMRTGMGAVPGSKTFAEYRYGYGPYVDGLFSQSNFGIVTKMGFWLMPQPESYLSGTVAVARYQDLAPLIELGNYLEDSGLITPPRYDSPASSKFFAPVDDELREMIAKGWPSDADLTDYAQRKKQSCWTLTLSMLGPPDTVKATWEYIKRRAANSIPGATFTDGLAANFPLTPEQKQTFPHKVAVGIPGMGVYFIVDRNPFNQADPPFGHADFNCVISRSAEAVHETQKALYQAYVDMGEAPQIGPFTVPQSWHQHAFIIAPIIWTYRDAERNKKSRALFDHLVKVASANGWASYRTSTVFQDTVTAQYSFGDHALLRFTEALKDAADPNGILSPGRGGIWPKHLRKEKKGDQT